MMIYNHIVSKVPITKGWSCDKKYCVETDEKIKYLLRVTPFEKSTSRADMFYIMRRVAALGVPMCKPIELGACDDGVYSIQSWIDGSDAEEIIPALSEEDQYAYGLEAGRILKQIHSIPAPPVQEDWEARFNRKIDRKIKMYSDCPVKYENGQAFIDYINENRHLLKSRPQCYQHGDYHIGNMMIDHDGQLQIIDFDRYDFGDPWEDIKAITWDIQTNPLFASGRIYGYFGSKIPGKFWSLLALYISLGTLSSLPWALPLGQDEIDTMTKLADQVLEWYDNMQNPVPKWYKGVI